MQASGIHSQMLPDTLSEMLPTVIPESTALSACVQTELMAAAHAGCYLTAEPFAEGVRNACRSNAGSAHAEEQQKQGTLF